MADIKTKYPSTSSVALTFAIQSLADDNTNGLAGRASTAVDNTTNVDIDHLVSGRIKLGTSPTVSRIMELWVYAAEKVASGTPTYPDSITGTDAAKTMTSRNVLFAALRSAGGYTTDATTGLVIPIAPFSIAQMFGGVMPMFWGLFLVNRSGVALDSTGSNHYFEYTRVQRQTV